MIPARILIAFTLLFLLACQSEKHTDDAEVTIEPLSDFSIYHLPGKWVTQHGDTLELEALRGKIVVTSMVYTQCNAACPYLVSEMKQVEAWAKKEGINDHLQYVLISFDPLADTPEQLSTFAYELQLDPKKWILLQGTEERVLEMAALLNTKYKRVGEIHFAHSNIISLLDTDGVLVHQREGYDTSIEGLFRAITLLLQK
jgi:protein SCO1